MPEQLDSPTGVQYSPVEAAPAQPATTLDYDSSSHFGFSSNHGALAGDYASHEQLHVDTLQQHLDTGADTHAHAFYGGLGHMDVEGQSNSYFHYDDHAGNPYAHVPSTYLSEHVNPHISDTTSHHAPTHFAGHDNHGHEAGHGNTHEHGHGSSHSDHGHGASDVGH